MSKRHNDAVASWGDGTGTVVYIVAVFPTVSAQCSATVVRVARNVNSIQNKWPGRLRSVSADKVFKRTCIRIIMRSGRDRALQEFRLVDEMPFCKEEKGVEQITSALENLMMRRVDQQLLNAKRRRLQSRKTVEPKEIDDVVVRALQHLCNAVQDCFAMEHQAAVVRNRVTSRRITKTARESKSKQIFRKKVLEETQRRTVIRQKKIERDIEEKIREATAIAIANRKEEVKAQRKEKDKRLLEVAEQEFNRIVRYEDEKSEKKFNEERVAHHAQICKQRRDHREDVKKSLATLRRGLDELDSAADAMLSRRFVIKT